MQRCAVTRVARGGWRDTKTREGSATGPADRVRVQSNRQMRGWSRARALSCQCYATASTTHPTCVANHVATATERSCSSKLIMLLAAAMQP